VNHGLSMRKTAARGKGAKALRPVPLALCVDGGACVWDNKQE
jgi:hypothetical protein